MAITKVSPALIQVANNVTSTTIGNTTSIPSLTFDASGVIISASNTTVTVANTNINGTITATQIAANSVNASILQTNSVENYMATSGRPLSNRNLINNGAMQVAQRGTSVTGITSSAYYTADRWVIALDSAGTWTMNVESSAPTDTEFRKSANVVCTTADSSLSASDFFNFQHRIEGQNLQGIKKGTTNAESLTFSFYVKSSNTGTYICDFRDLDNTRQISKSYTINTAHTWEKKIITLPPDTTGQFDNDNANSFVFHFWLAAGTDFTSGTLNSSAWASETTANRAVGQLNLANATGNYWAVTGVQLETGTVATPYEWMDFGTELSLCQRYFEKSYDLGITPGTATTNGQSYWVAPGSLGRLSISFQTKKRAVPTIILYSPVTGASGKVRDVTVSADVATSAGNTGEQATLSIYSSTSSREYSQHWTASAEL